MTRSQFKEDMQFRILRHLQKNPEMSRSALVKAAGISVGRINYVPNAFVDKGLMKLGTIGAAKDNRRHAYVLTSKGIAKRAGLTRSALDRKVAEYKALRKDIKTLKSEGLKESDLR